MEGVIRLDKDYSKKGCRGDTGSMTKETFFEPCL
jgi:hypothetical protein